jgi:hypothetical protein
MGISIGRKITDITTITEIIIINLAVGPIIKYDTPEKWCVIIQL